jgi:hypothetical protein
MATKKKSKKKQTAKKKPAAKKAIKRVTKKVTAKQPKAAAKKTKSRKIAKVKAKDTPKKVIRRVTRSARALPTTPGRESGDLQGLSRSEEADSESVSELVEEGNAFEADVISGVESADDADEQEVHTHEVPEDDVPEEYLDRD